MRGRHQRQLAKESSPVSFLHQYTFVSIFDLCLLLLLWVACWRPPPKIIMNLSTSHTSLNRSPFLIFHFACPGWTWLLQPSVSSSGHFQSQECPPVSTWAAQGECPPYFEKDKVALEILPASKSGPVVVPLPHSLGSQISPL